MSRWSNCHLLPSIRARARAKENGETMTTKGVGRVAYSLRSNASSSAEFGAWSFTRLVSGTFVYAARFHEYPVTTRVGLTIPASSG